MTAFGHSKECQPPLVVHIIFRLATGGLENGLVNLINGTPGGRYRHAIVCLTEATDFRGRLQPEIPIVMLRKREGQDLASHVRLWQTLREMRPHIVHTRNLPTLEYAFVAALAGVPGRVHGEHGRDVYDIDGSNRKYNILRRAIKPLIHRYITVSKDLAEWLTRTVGIPRVRIAQIYNGVDDRRFQPRKGASVALGPEGFLPADAFVIGTVGRMETVKNQLLLVRAFLRLLDLVPDARKRARLVIVGDGILREESLSLLRAAKAERLAWLPGERSDIPEIMRALNVFVLPSLAEGISNTILEAMASGLPIVATRVGGNPELVDAGETGQLVPPNDPEVMAKAFESYMLNPMQAFQHGQAGRKKIEAQFSMEAMITNYLSVYDAVLTRKPANRQSLALEPPDPVGRGSFPF